MQKLMLFLAILLSFNAFPTMDHLPFLTLKGRAYSDSEVVANVHLRAQADKPICKSTSTYFENSFTFPHVFTVQGRTFAGFDGSYYLDMSLKGRLIHKIEEAVNLERITLPESMEIKTYIDHCDFKPTLISLNLADSLLVIRNSLHLNIRSSFTIKNGRTKTVDFSLQKPRHKLAFEVNVN